MLRIQEKTEVNGKKIIVEARCTNVSTYDAENLELEITDENGEEIMTLTEDEREEIRSNALESLLELRYERETFNVG